MITVEGESTVYFDIDDTLIKWSDDFREPKDILGKGEKIEIFDPYDSSLNYLRPHRKHIDLLKKYKGRKMTVVVWSAAGVRWAESVIRALKLETYVDVVITKPTKYVDDLTSASDVLGTRVFLADK